MYCYALEEGTGTWLQRDSNNIMLCVPSDNDFINQMIENYSRSFVSYYVGVKKVYEPSC